MPFMPPTFRLCGFFRCKLFDRNVSHDELRAQKALWLHRKPSMVRRSSQIGRRGTLVSQRKGLVVADDRSPLFLGQDTLYQMNFPDNLRTSTSLEGRHVDLIAFFEDPKTLSLASQFASVGVEPFH